MMTSYKYSPVKYFETRFTFVWILICKVETDSDSEKYHQDTREEGSPSDNSCFVARVTASNLSRDMLVKAFASAFAFTYYFLNLNNILNFAVSTKRLFKV